MADQIANLLTRVGNLEREVRLATERLADARHHVERYRKRAEVAEAHLSRLAKIDAIEDSLVLALRSARYARQILEGVQKDG